MRLDVFLLGLPCLALGRSILSRSTPDIDAGCTICPKDTDPAWKKWVADTNAIPKNLLNEAAGSFQQTFKKGFKPPLCSHAGINCYYLEPGIDWVPSGQELRKPVGKYELKDKRKIYVFVYWNNMQKFGGVGGSVNIYAAHCVVELVVNGNAKANVQGKDYLHNGGYQGQGKYCIYDNYAHVAIYIPKGNQRNS
ncbi:hypothetical protein CBER1_11650 [Cercospora berteroae]|uniref:Uncharacterized protein n=1 Tax=Cercospora berteroae TaxID=357750 RepID=A0A2S6C042_9PEZI|nr:hypothetical protein CBER1_11650 [Cercospora berteroae]